MREHTEPMMQFFAYEHLPAKMQEASKPFCELADYVVAMIPRNPERTVALRKLLEAKDCAVRAMIYVETQKTPAQEFKAPKRLFVSKIDCMTITKEELIKKITLAGFDFNRDFHREDMPDGAVEYYQD